MQLSLERINIMSYMKLNSKQQKVLRIIKSNPDIANDDKKLLAAVWRAEGWSDQLTLEDNLKMVSNSETIVRVRRRLHELGYIEYSDEADKRREKEMLRHLEENGTPKAVSWLND